MACFLGVALAGRADELSERLIILANRDDPGSMRVAHHYAQVRHVPEANIIALSMPLSETISWTEFITQIWEPLEAELVRARWIDAIAMKLTDGVGRKKYAVSGHRISFLVTCRGVPLRIMHDPSRYGANNPFTDRAIFRTNQGAVDAELSLLARPNYNVNAFVPNALFHEDTPTELERLQVVKVSRLDGPTVEDAIHLVDSAVTAERTGLLGRAYVDIGGKLPDGDRWLEACAAQLKEIDFEPQVERSPATLAAHTRFDAPVIYLGWYAPEVNGPFDLPGFRFPPGAIAIHMHSYSAQTLRDRDAQWCGPLIARGATATVGNVFEPYFGALHRPDFLLRALVAGKNFGDAVYYAQPVLSWQTIAVGDPLYRPFAVSFDDQWTKRTALASPLAGYATVRKMKQLEAKDRLRGAIEVGRASQHDAPSIAVAVALAEALRVTGDAEAAANALSFVSLLESFPPDQLGLASRCATLLAGGGKAEAAVKVFRSILATKILPSEARRAWLEEAHQVATTAGDRRQASRWKIELDELSLSTRP